MSEAPWAGRRLHLIGIGGAGMSGLALVALALGAEVSGSDRADSPYCRQLRRAGIEPAIGHDAANLPDGAEVVVSTAIGDDNVELAAARASGASVLHRGDLLAELTRLRRTIAVAGAHGKTTMASMAAHVLLAAGLEAGYLIGGQLGTTGSNAAWGEGEWLVVEADESDRSFLKLACEVAVITNVELDHHATYRSLQELEQAFAEFARPARVRVCGEDVELDGPAETYGTGVAAALRAQEIELLPLGSRFEADGVSFELPVPGMHNVLNALGAALACRQAGVELGDSAQALRSFRGTGRRFEPHGETAAGTRVYDDYAHHPTEVRATLETARRTAGGGRLVACFQPHLYSRTQQLAREFGQALALADEVVVLDVYPARERAEDFPGVSGLSVAAAAADSARGRPVHWLPRMEDAERLLARRLGAGDLLVTLGAGDVDSLARSLAGSRGEG